MENAVKALYMAAGMLLGVMILGVWVYLFRQGARLGQSYEADKVTKQIQAFNSQFEKYTVVTNQRGASDGYTFENKGNLPSDVITCANLAFDVNTRNEFDEFNCVEMEVKINASTIYYIHSAKAQPKNNFLINTGKTAARAASSFDTTNPSVCKSFYDFMKEYNKVKIVNIKDPSKTPNDYSSTAESIYEYYFDVKPDGFHYSDKTGKVDKIVFTAVKTNGFNNLGGGNWTENI